MQDREMLSRKTREELKKDAKEMGLRGVSTLKKEDIIKRILEALSQKEGNAEVSDRKESAKPEENTSVREYTKPDENAGVKEYTKPDENVRVREYTKPEENASVREYIKPDENVRVREYTKPDEYKRPRENTRTYDYNRRVRDNSRYGDNTTVGENTRYSEPRTDRESTEPREYRYTPRPVGIRRETKVRERPSDVEQVCGVLEVMGEGYGFLRMENYRPGEQDIYVSPQQIKRFSLKTGDEIVGDARPVQDTDRYSPLLFVKTINDDPIDKALKRRGFEKLIPIYPEQKLKLETSAEKYATRLIDIIAPIGKGQRGLIVAPPKAGKTTLMKQIAKSVENNYPDCKLIVLLIDERPEEVTDMKRSIKGDVIYSTFDQPPENHIKVAEMVLERAQRLVEQDKDVVVLLDSITRLARAYNLTVTPTGRTLSGGLDPDALYKPKKFFGAARKIENGGSLTILATALVETGSRMDDVIYEEFKGTGNMELKLDRSLQERRIFPALDILKSGTRHEEKLLSEDELEVVWGIRREVDAKNQGNVISMLLNHLTHTRDNAQLVNALSKIYRNSKG